MAKIVAAGKLITGIDQDGDVIEEDRCAIQLSTGELWSVNGQPRLFNNWQDAQREFAEGNVPSGIESELKEAKSGKASKT